jgi:hypothetical protein
MWKERYMMLRAVLPHGDEKELEAREAAARPALRELLAGQKPQHLNTLRRNVALHAEGDGGDILLAGPRALREAQRGPRLEQRRQEEKDPETDHTCDTDMDRDYVENGNDDSDSSEELEPALVTLALDRLIEPTAALCDQECGHDTADDEHAAVCLSAEAVPFIPAATALRLSGALEADRRGYQIRAGLLHMVIVAWRIQCHRDQRNTESKVSCFLPPLIPGLAIETTHPDEDKEDEYASTELVDKGAVENPPVVQPVPTVVHGNAERVVPLVACMCVAWMCKISAKIPNMTWRIYYEDGRPTLAEESARAAVLTIVDMEAFKAASDTLVHELVIEAMGITSDLRKDVAQGVQEAIPIVRRWRREGGRLPPARGWWAKGSLHIYEDLQ